MPRKNYSWAKVKATKTPDEWRKINKAYAQRFRLRNQLKIKGAELLNKIHNYRLIQSPEPADTAPVIPNSLLPHKQDQKFLQKKV